LRGLFRRSSGFSLKLRSGGRRRIPFGLERLLLEKPSGVEKVYYARHAFVKQVFKREPATNHAFATIMSSSENPRYSTT
jgi:hypothetical protein